jgi:radical SAM superfamily enzyme YgiQ (UPF0313 family)
VNKIEPIPGGREQSILKRIFPNGKIERVLLVVPPDADESLFRLDTAKRGRYTNYPPYGLLIVAERLREIGVKVSVSNLNNDILKHSRICASDEFDFKGIWQSKLDADIARFEPDLIGVSCMFTMTHGSLKSVCDRGRDAGIPIAIGGVHVSNDVDRVMDDIQSASIAFLGEAEIAFQTFVQVVNRKVEIDQLHQAVISDGGHRMHFDEHKTPTSEQINMPPAYDLIDVAEYSNSGTIGAFYCFKPAGTKFATVLSNRGCRAQCTFCSVRNFNGPGVRQRSISSVVDELDFLANDCGIGHIMWLDDDLLKNHGRAIDLFNEIISRNLPLTWDATNGVIASSCTDEVIHAARDSGCIALNIGMESGNPKILKTVRKPATVETFLKAAEVLRKYDEIHASVFLMIGFPGETMSMILDTIKVAGEMNLDWCRISQLQPLPNTPIHEAMVAQGLAQEIGGNDLRFDGGAYGKQTEFEQGLKFGSSNFVEAFSSIPLDTVPTPERLTDIWFFMNYHLNFRRIFHEHNATKIGQLTAHLNVLADVISPENGFALYFLAYLEYRRNGVINSHILARLRARLETSEFWSDRLYAFGLSVDDFATGIFPSSFNLLDSKLATDASLV